MKVKIAIIFILFLHNIQTFAGEKDACFRNMNKIVDKFIDLHRNDIGGCEQSSDCVWMAVGSGLHLNKKYYSKWARCYRYASARSEAYCRNNKSTRENMGLSGLGMAYRNPNHPIAYTCLKNQCSPIFNKDDTKFKEKDKTLWKNFFPSQNDDPYLKDGEICKDDFDRDYLPQLNSNSN